MNLKLPTLRSQLSGLGINLSEGININNMLNNGLQDINKKIKDVGLNINIPKINLPVGDIENKINDGVKKVDSMYSDATSEIGNIDMGGLESELDMSAFDIT